MMEDGSHLPLGMRVLKSIRKRQVSPGNAKVLVLVLTFLCYASFHASRKPPSIVKSVLHVDHNTIPITNVDPSTDDLALLHPDEGEGWAPFDAENGKILLGNVDCTFLVSYALGMFCAGHLGDRMDLRLFLTGGMLGSGVFVSLFGMGYFWDIHSYWYYVAVSIMAGLFQSTGWPSVVSIMANWYGKGNRGLVMGIWNAHTSVGNITGTVLAATMLRYGWGWSFLLPGMLIGGLALVMFLFLVVSPAELGAKAYKPLPTRVRVVRGPRSPSAAGGAASSSAVQGRQPFNSLLQHSSSASDLSQRTVGEVAEEAYDSDRERGLSGRHASGGAASSHGISFLQAWLIPGVLPFALCLFFAKLVAYTFLYWLPYYLKTTPVAGEVLSTKQAGDLSILFDVGGVLGGVLSGFMSDALGSSALTAVTFLMASLPTLYAFRTFGHVSLGMNVGLMMLSGLCVNGPYALITTAVSADLGSSDTLNGDGKALATVTAIIDGMGSIGAALGPSLVGYISQLPGGFDNVFLMLYVSAACAALLLFKLARAEAAVLLAAATNAPGGLKPTSSNTSRATAGSLQLTQLVHAPSNS